MTRPVVTLGVIVALLATLASGASSPARAQSVEPPPRLNGLTGLGDIPSIVLPSSSIPSQSTLGKHRYNPVTCLIAGQLQPCRMTDFSWLSIPALDAGRGLKGVVEVICRIDGKGSLQGCEAGETAFRPDMRLALKLTSSFQVPATLSDGARTVGGYVMFHVLAFPTHQPEAYGPAPSDTEGAPEPFKVVETGDLKCRSRLDMKTHALVLAGVIGLPVPTRCAPTETYAQVKARFDRLRPAFNQLAAAALKCGRMGRMEEIWAQLPLPATCPNGGMAAAEQLRALLQKTELLTLRIEPVADPNHVDSASIKLLRFSTGSNGFAVTPGSSASELIYVVGDEHEGPVREAGYEMRPVAPHWQYVLVSDPGVRD